MEQLLRNSVVALMLLAGAGTANALEEHNPLDVLGEKACKPIILKPGETKPEENDISHLRIERDDVLKTAIGKNGLPPPKKFDTSATYIDMLADVMIPCANLGNSGSPDTTPAARINACKAELNQFQRSEESRYGTDDVRAIRQNLLRFFQSGRIGGPKPLIVIRRVDIDEFGENSQSTISDQTRWWTNYRPFINRHDDDYALLHYIYAPDPQPGAESTEASRKVPFDVYCASRKVMYKDATEPLLEIRFSTDEFKKKFKDGKYYYADTPAGDAGAGWDLFKRAFKEFKVTKEETTEQPFEKDSAQDASEHPYAKAAAERISDETEPALAELKMTPSAFDGAGESLKYRRASSKSLQLVLAKDANQFIKSKREGAEFGTTNPRGDDKVIDSGNIEFAANAALGLHYRLGGSLTAAPACQNEDGAYVAGKDCKDKIPRPEYKSSWNVGLTPYVGVSQESKQMLVYALNSENTLALAKKKFDYAKLFYGARIDYASRLASTPRLGTALNNPTDIYTAALDKPGWGWGLYGEYITDNYNLLGANRFGGYFTPPADWFGVAGNYYGRSFPLDVRVGHDKDPPYGFWDDMRAGWYLKWDALVMAENLDHSRLPRKLDAAPCYDPVLFECDDSYDGEIWIRKKPDEIVDGGVYGTDVSLSLGRYELFGLGKEDLFAEVTAKWVYRREFDHSNSAGLWNLSLKVQDPTGSESRYWKIEYIVGEDYVAGTEDEKISLKVVLAN